MDLWFTETYQDRAGITVKIRQTLCLVQSPYQEIAVLETDVFGRMLVLDGMVMATERDEHLYHEMLVHPTLCVHEDPRRILVIGGGDGGTVREILRHPTIEHIDLVELDEEVVRQCQIYLPTLSTGLTDRRVQMHFQDGAVFIAQQRGSYDAIFVDSTDPIGPAAVLVSEQFYHHCRTALRPGGILALQSESPLVHQEELRIIHTNLRRVFPKARLYVGPVTTYPSGYWSYGFASNERDPLRDLQEERAEELENTLQYYNAEVHRAAFALPSALRRMLASCV